MHKFQFYSTHSHINGNENGHCSKQSFQSTVSFQHSGSPLSPIDEIYFQVKSRRAQEVNIRTQNDDNFVLLRICSLVATQVVDFRQGWIVELGDTDTVIRNSLLLTVSNHGAHCFK